MSFQAIHYMRAAGERSELADDCFPWLDAPVKRVASTDTFVGYAPALEDAILPQVDTFRKAYAEIMAF